MNRPLPLVSIGLTVYNSEKYLRQTLDSLLALNYENFELIISDNASTDATPEICLAYQSKDSRIQYFHNSVNLGASLNFKKVFELSSGEYWMWTSGHDLYDPAFIRTCLNLFAAAEDTVLVYSPTTYINQSGQKVRTENMYAAEAQNSITRFSNVINGQTTSNALYGLFKADTMSNISVYESLAFDTLYLAELSLYGKFVQLGETLYYRRQNRPLETFNERIKRYIDILLVNINDFRKAKPLEYMVYNYFCMIQNNDLRIAEQSILNIVVLDTLVNGWGISLAETGKLIQQIDQYKPGSNPPSPEKNTTRQFKPPKYPLDIDTFIQSLQGTTYEKFADSLRPNSFVSSNLRNESTLTTKKFHSPKKYDVTYLMYDTSKWGGTKGTFVQANGLIDRGYKVCVVAKTPAPDWFPLKCDFIQSPNLDAKDIPDSDIVIGTWFPTVQVAYAAQKGIPVHYCRGYEAQQPGLSDNQKTYIKTIYQLSTVKIANAPHVARLLKEKFNADAYVVKNDINHQVFYPQQNTAPKDPSQRLRILIIGPYEVAWKGVKDCLNTCALLAQQGLEIEVVRASQTALTAEEKQLASAAGYEYNYHHNLSEQEMAQLYNTCDVLLSGSHPTVESFGRPVMEALACGLPVVTTNIPAYKDYDPVHDYATFIEPGDVNAMAQATAQVITNAALREDLVNRGLQVSSRYGEDQTLDDLERALQDIYRKHSEQKPTTVPSQAPNYYQFSRPEIQERIPTSATTILDVGCAAGVLGKVLKDRQPCEVTGIEYVPVVAEQARTVLDRVYSGDVNEIALTLPKNYFDAIIFADVLEHLPDPAITLERLLPTLSPNGKIIISIPNVRHWSVVKGLLEGQWEYEEAGLLDRTHLRFFTRNSFEKLLSQVGLKPISVGATRVNYPSVPNSIINSLRQEGLNVSTLAQESQVYQWLYVAEPISASSATPALTSIIILTHNQLDYTKLCLQSIQDHTPEPHELIIVDNGSTDGTRDYLRRYQTRHNNVKIIANKENLGFAAGNNQGLALAEGDTVLLLNNDTVVTDGWLGNMLAVFQQHPEVGIVGPVSNNISGPQKIETDYRTLDEIHPFARQWSAAHQGQSEENFRVVGFCLLARREVIDRIGGLDERYGSGNFEDDDFCIRGLVVGFKARIARDAFVHHFGSQTFKGAGIDYNHSLHHNWELFKKKWNIPADTPYGSYRISLPRNPDLSAYFIPLPPEDQINQLGNEPLIPAPLQPGYAALEGHDLDTALTEFTTAAEQHPDMPEAHTALGQTLLVLGRPEEALKPLRRAIKLDSNQAVAHNLLGKAQYRLGRHDKAKAAFKKAITADPNNIEARLNLVDFYKSHNDLKKALAMAREALALGPKNVDVLTTCGLLMLDTDDLTGAEMAWQELPPTASVIHPGVKALMTGLIQRRSTVITPDTLLFAVDTAQQAEDWPQAIALLKTLLGMTAGDDHATANLWNRLGVSHHQAGNTVEAMVAFEAALKLAPDAIDLLSNLVNIYYNQGQFDKATGYLNRILQIDLDDVNALMLLGNCAIELAEPETALMAFRRVQALAPDTDGIDQLVEQLSQFVQPEAAAGLSAGDAVAAPPQVLAAQEAGQWQQAIALVDELLPDAMPGELAALHNSRGYSHFMLEQFEQAEQSFSQGLEHQPDNLNLLNNLAQLYLQQERYDLGTEYLTRALRVNPGDLETLLAFGNCAIELGDLEAARMAFERVQALAPDTPGVEAVLAHLASLEPEININ